MKKHLTILLMTIFLVIAISGCQEETTSGSNKQARLMGNENLRLKDVIKDKDAEIANLHGQIKEMKKKNMKLQQQTMSAAESLSGMMSGANKTTPKFQKRNKAMRAKIVELKKENEALKAKIEQL